MFQFPTGWNSTRLFSAACKHKDAFQFPTGWNSTQNGACQSERKKQFQFPTGWNSTDFFVVGASVSASVSIPNGMEFYLVPAHSIKAADELVSIPNGMEFYETTSREVVRVAEFQFPTGWNSTLKSLRQEYSDSVSIPNGMEFYLKEVCKSFGVEEFQFPTGWNSTFDVGYARRS